MSEARPTDDLRNLFKKYIRHVVNMEGINFISSYKLENSECTDAEWEMLKQLAKEVKEEQ